VELTISSGHVDVRQRGDVLFLVWISGGGEVDGCFSLCIMGVAMARDGGLTACSDDRCVYCSDGLLLLI